jgi:hypothetical protein
MAEPMPEKSEEPTVALKKIRAHPRYVESIEGDLPPAPTTQGR